MKPSGRVVIGHLIFVGIATMVANGSSYILSMIAARSLSVPDYGALGALLSVSMIGGTVALGIQAVGARRIAIAEERFTDVKTDVSTLSYRLTLSIAFAGLLLSWPLSVALNVSFLASIFTFGSIAASVLGFSALGIVQGEERHKGFGYSYAAIGSLRAAGGVLAMFVDPTVTMTCLGIFLGSLLGSAVSICVAHLPRPHVRLPRSLSREFTQTTVALAALFALSNADVLLARLFLEPQQSGEYAVGALIAKIAFFLPSAVNAVLFPKMASGTMRHALLIAVLLTSALGAVTTVLCFALGEPLLWLLGGDKYSDLGHLAWLFALVGSAFAVIQVVLYAGFSARARLVAVLAWVTLLIQIVTVALWFNNSVFQIVVVTAAVAVSLALVGVRIELGKVSSWGRAVSP